MADTETIEVVEEIMEEVEETVNSKVLKIDLSVDQKKTQETIKSLEEAFESAKKKMEVSANGIKNAMNSLASSVHLLLSDVKGDLTEAFTVTNVEEFQEAADRFGEGLASALFSMDGNMKVLESAIIDSVTPIAAVVVPVINEALLDVIALVDGIGQCVGNLANNSTITDSLTLSITALQPLAKWLLEDFLQPIAQWTGGMIIGTLQSLADALGMISTWILDNQVLVQAMTSIVAAFAAVWSVTDLVFFIDKLGGVPAIISAVTTAINQCTLAKIASKAEDIAIIALYAVDYVKQFGVMVGQLAACTAGWVANTAAKVASTAAEWAQIAATTAWTAICATAAAVTSAFGAAMSVLTSPITLVVAAIAAVIGVVVLLIKNWDTVKAAAISAWESIKEAFGKAWTWFKDTVVDPLVNGFKGAVNGVIGFINGLIAGVVKGINSIVQMLNSLKFTVPDWVPGLGGQTLGFHLKTVTTPQIPYLAQGAVLPANRPFLAMVGDQRHGTNIEAPLATIQEAVAMTMEDFAAGNMAGHQATVAVLQEILEAVLGIHISDTEIGRAAERYQSKIAIARGNVW